MRRFLLVSLPLIGLMLISSCSKDGIDPELPKTMELEGLLQKRDLVLTTYQYGEYFIDTTALRSETIDLGLYVGELVRVKGSRIEGYPLSGGPVYVEVENIVPLGLSPGSE